MTPGASSPHFNPQTPGAGMEHAFAVDWQTPDIEVRIREVHDDDDLIGQTGIIRGISGGMCAVFLLKEDRVVNILSEHLEPVMPKQGDKVGLYKDCIYSLIVFYLKI
jgi:transcription elongation factor SPT5